MAKMRLRFSKTGKAKYISHLDLMRTFQRTFMRSQIAIKHTEGFNPHAYISIALPLSVGCESLCEVLDVDISDGTNASIIPEKLNPCLPEGIHVISASEPVKKPGALKYLRFRSELVYDGGNAPDIAEKLKTFFARDRLIILKKSKSGRSEFDLKPYIKSYEVYSTDENSIILEAVVSAQNPTVNPSHIQDAISQLEPRLSPSFSKDMRIEIYDEEMNVFI